MKKIAFVTGMTGQDGPYLAKHLLENDYKVYGLVKRYSNPNLTNLNYLGIENAVELITGDVTDDANMNHLIRTCLLYTSPSPRDRLLSRMPSSA